MEAVTEHVQYSPHMGVEIPLQGLQVSQEFLSNTYGCQTSCSDAPVTTNHPRCPTSSDPLLVTTDLNPGTENLPLSCSKRDDRDSEGQDIEGNQNLEILKGSKFGGQIDKSVHIPKSASERTTASQRAKLRTIQRRREQNHIPRRIRNYTIKDSDDPN